VRQRRPPSPARSAETEREKTIATALDGALAAFAEGGLTGLSVAAVCDRAQLSVGSLYHHFGNRRGVLVALYQRSLFSLLDALRPSVEASELPTVISSLVALYLDWVRAHTDAARFVLSAAPAELDDAALVSLAEGTQQRLTPLVARVLQAAAAGHIVTMPLPYYELMIIGPIAETARRWLGGAPLDLDEAQHVLTEAILRTLRP
jgi:AcrR family transcriptional regulator